MDLHLHRVHFLVIILIGCDCELCIQAAGTAAGATTLPAKLNYLVYDCDKRKLSGDARWLLSSYPACAEQSVCVVPRLQLRFDFDSTAVRLLIKGH